MQGFTEADVIDPPKPAQWLDGMGVVSEDTYPRKYVYQIIAGSAKDPSLKGRLLMKGCRWCLKQAHAWSYTSSTWGGLAVDVARRYFRRFYPKTIFFDNDELLPILKKIADRYPMEGRTLNSFYDRFIFYHPDDYVIYWKGEARFLTRDQYQMCLSIYRQTEKLKQLEENLNEKATRN